MSMFKKDGSGSIELKQGIIDDELLKEVDVIVEKETKVVTIADLAPKKAVRVNKVVTVNDLKFLR